MSTNKVPVVIYTKDGGRQVIGEAEVEMTEEGVFCAMVMDDASLLAVKSPMNMMYKQVALKAEPYAPGLDDAAFSVGVEQTINEIDRQARAYGWEIGHGQRLLTQLTAVTPGNPFLLENWREMVRTHDHKPIQHRDNKPPWCNTCGLG